MQQPAVGYAATHVKGRDFMAGMRWKEEREEVIELVYRIQADHGGSVPEREARKFGPWAVEAVKRARRIRWLNAKGNPPTLSVTNKGSKALDSALSSRGVLGSQWFGGCIVPVSSPYGPVIMPQSFEPYEELKRQAVERGLVTQEDVERVSRSERAEPEEPGEFRTLEEMTFPGMRGFAVAPQYDEGHPLGGGMMKAEGYEGAYQVTVTLTRRGAPDIPYVYMTDAFALEGDSHLWLQEEEVGEDRAVRRLLLVHASQNGEDTEFELIPNRQGRLGQIRTVLRADGAEDARRTAYHLLNPFLCDLSFRYDLPIEVLQTNAVELATLTLSGVKQDDFHEKLFDPEKFLGSGIDYRGELPNYEFFTRLYREGANSSSADYGFLCFFRIAEGVVKLRRKRVAEGEGRSEKEVSRPDLFFEDEVVEHEGEDAASFSPELRGKSIWEAYEALVKERVKIGHAFLNDEDPVWEHADIIADRLEGEERSATRRAQARYVARRMLKSEFWTRQ